MKQCSRKKYYFLYTVLFCIAAILVYGYFIFYHKSFVGYSGNRRDSLTQHYPALCYYARYLRQIIRTLLDEHRLVIPEWSFSIGYGSDIIATLHYYAFGDPFNLGSVLVPTRFMPYFYSFITVMRMYCAGIAFSELCFYTMQKRRRSAAVLAGSLVYVFSAYAIYVSAKHPFFLNPMVFFPLLILGVEKILKKDSPLLFVVTVCISACSNFYFFYMLALLTAAYVVLRLAAIYGLKNIRKYMLELMRIAGCAVTGLLMSMVLFLPTVSSLLQDSRMSAGKAIRLLYPGRYYSKFFSAFLTSQPAGQWTFTGFAGIGLIAIFLLFLQKRKYGFFKLSFLILTAFLMLPAAGYVLNGFSYPANRWSWAYSLLVSYITVIMWPHLFNLSARERNGVTAGLITWFLICYMMDNTRMANLAFGMCCTFAAFLVFQLDFSSQKKKFMRQIPSALIFFILLANISVNAYFSFSVKVTSDLEDFESFGNLNARVFKTKDVAVAAASEGETEFFRYAQGTENTNSTLGSGLYSTQYYWSLSNPSIVESNQTLGVLDIKTHNSYGDLNSRAGLSALANIKYFTSKAGSGIQYAPYGYEFAGTYKSGFKDEKWDVYRNLYILPFGYTYGSLLDLDQFSGLNPVEKEEAMLQGAYVDPALASLPQIQADTTSGEVPFEIVCDDGNVSCQGQSFVTTDASSVTLNFQEVKNCELYLLLDGLQYKGCSPIDLYRDDTPFDPLNLYTEQAWENMSRIRKTKLLYKSRNWEESDTILLDVSCADDSGQSIERKFYLYTPENVWYMGKDCFAVHLGYSQAGRTSIRIAFPGAGIYSYKNIQVISNPLTSYEDNIGRLKADCLENVVFDTDRVTGEITLSENKLLCMSIPYADGWSAFVDGEKAEILKTNLMYSGLMLEAGTHTIDLRYETPYLRVGLILSLLGTACLLLLLYHRRRRLRQVLGSPDDPQLILSAL